ncbi:MAG: FG-GAP-like repeat-containing protein, partial [Bacteroidota bacterium]
VAGAAALLRSIDPTLTPEAIRSILTSTALDLGVPGWDHDTGAGLLDVAAALGEPFPGRVEIESPRMDGGVAVYEAAVVGSALAPRFARYALDVAACSAIACDEDTTSPDDRWERIAGPFTEQVRRDTLAVWDTRDFAEGGYILRLVVETNDGRTLEARHRITLDRTPPVATLRYVGPAFDDGRAGLFVDVEADEPVRASLLVPGLPTATAPQIVSTPGLFVPYAALAATTLSGTLRLENAAGLVTELRVSAAMPTDRRALGFLEERPTNVPSGYLLPRLVDFDQDGLGEVILNEAPEPGVLGDTVGVYEWSGQPDAPLRRAATYLVPAIPRDVGDTNGDGRLELLFQVDPITLLVEASQPGGYPDTEAFRDEEGTTPTGTPLWGARLADLDSDGRGEILGLDLRSPRFQPLAAGEEPEDTAWRVMERNGTTFGEVARLRNETGVSPPLDRNLYQRPLGLTADFDGNGRTEWLTGDADGDLLLYEADGDDQYRLVWTHETDRFNAGQRMATGDFDGDGLPEFASFTTEFIADDLGAPAYGVLTVWDRAFGQDPQPLVEQVFVGDSRLQGALAALDFDGDGRDEVIVQHALQLWVLRYDGDTWLPVFHRGPDARAPAPTGLAGPQLAVGDLGAGQGPALFVAGLDGGLRWFRYATPAGPAPRWVESFALDEARVRLSWFSGPGSDVADSTVVFAARGDAPFDEVARTDQTSLELPADTTLTYALASVRDGQLGPLSEVRTVRPHAPAVVQSAEIDADGVITLAFSEELAVTTTADQFSLDEGEVTALLIEGRRAVMRTEAVLPGTRLLSWRAVRDAEGTPVADTEAALNAASNQLLLHITSFEILSPTETSIAFSSVLDSLDATNVANYVVSPRGRVDRAELDGSDGRAVRLTLADGIALGATGQPTTIRVVNLRGAANERLAPEGNVVTLTRQATSLDAVFVYPNPASVRAGHDSVTIAELPDDAEVSIYTADGARVRTWTERVSNGGLEWDLRDEAGRAVGSGVYLIRVEADGSRPVLVKLALRR